MKKSFPLYLPQLIPRSNSGEISVPLAVHNPPLFLYFCTLEIFPSWITIFLIIYLLRLIPLFYLSSFLLSLFSTFNFAPITPNNLYNTFKRIRLTSADLSGRMLLLCLPQYLDPPPLLSICWNFFLSLPPSGSIQLYFSFLKLITSLLLLLLLLFALSRFLFSLKTAWMYLLLTMPLSQILISFPPVSLVFIDLTAWRRSCFTALTSCFVISIIVSLFPSMHFIEAFNIVNHDLLLVKLKLCGLSYPLSLIYSFLTNCIQQVLIYNSFPLFSSIHAVLSECFSGFHSRTFIL